MRYYDILIFITCLYMVVQLVQLYEDEVLTRKEKKYFSVIAVSVIVGTTCEYFGLFLNNTPNNFKFIHGLVKAIEFSLAPCIPILYCLAIDFEKKIRMRKIIICTFLITNAILELASIFTPLIFYINNQNVYVHGKYYAIYVGFYLIGIIYFMYVFLKSSKKYQNKDRLSLTGIIIFFIVGFTITKLYSDIKIDWLMIAMIFSIFIHYYAKLILKVDALTLLLNRRSYENQLKKINYQTAIIRFDVNEFKKVNDTYGHQFGDMCLKVIGSTIYEAYGKVGYCYRTGGDEFDVILKPNQLDYIASNSQYDIRNSIDNLNNQFNELFSKQIEKFPMLSAGISIGYGIFYGYVNSFEGKTDERYTTGIISNVVEIADKRMYEAKSKARVDDTH